MHRFIDALTLFVELLHNGGGEGLSGFKGELGSRKALKVFLFTLYV